MTDNTSWILRLAAAAALMALAANCFLKYLWWTACYSAWYGIPKLAEQWKAAGSNASFNGWTLIVLDAGAVALFFSLITLALYELVRVLQKRCASRGITHNHHRRNRRFCPDP